MYVCMYVCIAISYVLVGNEYDPATSLNEYMRRTRVSMGTKYMCREGGCGMCVVEAKLYDPVSKLKQSYSINSVRL